MEQTNAEKNNIDTNGQSAIADSVKHFTYKHSSMSVIVKKTEKIATAIYMVTDFVLESEPLRHQLRALSLSLISATRKVGSRSAGPESAIVEDTRAAIEEILVLVSLASTIGIVSEMNAKIIRTELEKIREEFEVLYGGKKAYIVTHPGYANILLDQSMFDIAEPSPLARGVLSSGDKGQKDNSNVLYKKDFENNGSTDLNRKRDLGLKIARRNDVLNVVRKIGKASIKDVSLILKDTSEKTVQRELLALVKEGALKKEGEKRWSTYRIAE